MHLRALENLTKKYPLLTTIDRISLVKSTWHHPKASAGAPAPIKRLRGDVHRYAAQVSALIDAEIAEKSRFRMETK